MDEEFRVLMEWTYPVYRMRSKVIEAEKLKQIINKIETIEEDRTESAELLKDAFNEAKSMGFDVKIIKHVLKERKTKML